MEQKNKFSACLHGMTGREAYHTERRPLRDLVFINGATKESIVLCTMDTRIAFVAQCVRLVVLGNADLTCMVCLFGSCLSMSWCSAAMRDKHKPPWHMSKPITGHTVIHMRSNNFAHRRGVSVGESKPHVHDTVLHLIRQHQTAPLFRCFITRRRPYRRK